MSKFSHAAPLISSRGVIASILSSVLYAALYFVTPHLAPASPEGIWAIRNFITVPFVLLVLLTTRQMNTARDVITKVRKKPLLIVGIVVCGFLVSVQIWVFGYAPLHGRGLQVALGYFLLPLVLVVVGRLLYKDRLAWWQWAAAGVAALGVAFEVVRVGSISWETLVVALGYPAYFVLRRAMGTNHLGGMLWEWVALFPIAIVFLIIELGPGTLFVENPALVWIGPLFALMSALAYVLYIVALRLLIISLFGLLSYIEPALLVVASVLNGEQIAADEWVIYGAIWAAVLMLVTGGAREMIRSMRDKASPS